jgi:hypothetical protein
MTGPSEVVSSRPAFSWNNSPLADRSAVRHTLVIGSESSCQILFLPFEAVWSPLLEECHDGLVLTVVPNSASREDRGNRLPLREWAGPEVDAVNAVVENERLGMSTVAALTPAGASTVRGSPQQQAIGKELLQKPHDVSCESLRAFAALEVRIDIAKVILDDLTDCDGHIGPAAPYADISNVRMLRRKHRDRVGWGAEAQTSVTESLNQSCQQNVAISHSASGVGRRFAMAASEFQRTLEPRNVPVAIELSADTGEDADRTEPEALVQGDRAWIRKADARHDAMDVL